MHSCLCICYGPLIHLPTCWLQHRWNFDYQMLPCDKKLQILPQTRCCGVGRLRELGLKRNCRNYSASLNSQCGIGVPMMERDVLNIPMGKIAFKRVFFVSYSISHISLASSTQDVISPLLPGHKEHWDFPHSISPNFNFSTKVSCYSWDFPDGIESCSSY